MRIAICDDQPEWLEQLRQYIEAYFAQQDDSGYAVDAYPSGEALLASDTVYDAVFLDVELGGINGMDVARALLQRSKNTAIIIVTSHRGYLDDAMDLKALRFIDKPLEEKRVFSALKRVAFESEHNTLTLHARDNSLVTLRKSELLYAEARLRWSLVVSVQGEYLVKEGIHCLQELLQGSPFAVPHNSYVVNMNYIRIFRREEVQLCQGGKTYTVPVSLRRQSAFRKEYIRFIGEG